MAIITISRGSLSGGAELASQLGTRLGAKVISREVIVEAAKKYGISENTLIDGIKNPPGLWDRLTHHKEQYILAVQATLAEMIAEGNVIYHGYGGQFLLKELSNVIKLRLIAPINYRVQAAMAEMKIDFEHAKRYIESIDEQRMKWVRLLYGEEWTDPTIYDLVLNLAHISIDTCCELVVDLVGREEYRRTPETLQQRRDFVLETKIKAELCFNTEFSEKEIEVKVKRNILTLSGAYFEKNRNEIMAFLKSIPNVREAIEKTQAISHVPDDLNNRPIHARESMIPIDKYPFVHKWLSIKEAIAALSTSSIKLKDGEIMRPRFILVHDENEHLVGVIARRNLLSGLTPQLQDIKRLRKRMKAINMPTVDGDFLDMVQWGSLFSAKALLNANDSVESVMDPISCSVGPDESLSMVITTMLQHSVDLLPVIEGQKVLGVILMTEVFDSVAEYIMEGKTQKTDEVSNTPPK